MWPHSLGRQGQRRGVPDCSKEGLPQRPVRLGYVQDDSLLVSVSTPGGPPQAART